jgi:hypothetical protein
MRSYESDFAGWAEDTARAICDGRWSEIDREHLADEVADLARRERRAIRSRYTVLFLHLLKQRYQPMKASRSWDATILEQRIRLRELLDENPSLATDSETSDAITKAYTLARVQAVRETGLPLDTFPVELPFGEDEIWGQEMP